MKLSLIDEHTLSISHYDPGLIHVWYVASHPLGDMKLSVTQNGRLILCDVMDYVIFVDYVTCLKVGF